MIKFDISEKERCYYCGKSMPLVRCELEKGWIYFIYHCKKDNYEYKRAEMLLEFDKIIQNDIINKVISILSDNQVYLGNSDHYDEYEKLINYFKNLKKKKN